MKAGPGGKEGFWIVDAKNGNGDVQFNGEGLNQSINQTIQLSFFPSIINHYDKIVCSAKPDVTLTIADSDLFDLMTGKLNSQKAFFQGKLKVGRVLDTPPKLRP